MPVALRTDIAPDWIGKRPLIDPEALVPKKKLINPIVDLKPFQEGFVNEGQSSKSFVNPIAPEWLQKRFVTAEPNDFLSGFANTEEAWKYGESIKDNSEKAQELESRYYGLQPSIDDAKVKRDFQRGMDLAVEKQKMREALEKAISGWKPKTEGRMK